MQCKDQLHTVFDFLQTPKRIVSLVPSQTELLIDLGLKKTSTRDHQILRTPNIS